MFGVDGFEGGCVGRIALARAICGGLPLLTKRRRAQHAVSHLAGARENGGAAGEMCRVRDGDSRRGSGLRRVRGACRRAAICSGGRAVRFPHRGSVLVSEVFHHSSAAWL